MDAYFQPTTHTRKKNRKKIEAKDQNAKIEKSPKKRDAENPRMRCWLTVCARSRVLHRLSQIVYSNNISAANQKTDFGAKGVHFFPKKSPPTGSSTLKQVPLTHPKYHWGNI